MLNEPIMENKQSRRNKIQKKVCSSARPSAGPQTCPDFKMERQMRVTNSQLM